MHTAPAGASPQDYSRTAEKLTEQRKLKGFETRRPIVTVMLNAVTACEYVHGEAGHRIFSIAQHPCAGTRPP
eukprot:2725218-Pleurochrysis_carterae.AAC.3